MAEVKFDANSRVSLSNADAGTGNTVVGYLAGDAIGSGDNYNVFIGENVADANMTNAVYNIGIGYQALTDLTTGDYNICIGGVAGENIQDGSQNVLIGTSCGDGLISETDNVAIGHDALSHANPQADKVVAIGSGSLGGDLTSDADGTVAIGYGALAALTSGIANVAIGYQAHAAQTDGGYNTVIGHQAMLASDSGESNNVVIGYWAGKAVNATATDNNVFIGYKAGQGGTGTRAGNVAIGSGAWDADVNVAGSENVFIGQDSGGGTWATGGCDGNTAVGWGTMAGAMNAAGNNTAVGKSALAALTEGDRNTAVGKDALLALTDGLYNTVIGYDAGTALVGGTHNVIIGDSAGIATTTVDKTVLIGQGAGAGALTAGADGTVAVGWNALNACTSGSENVAVGMQAGNTTSTAEYCTFVGHQSGGTSNGNYNTAIGWRSGNDQTTGTGNTTVGADAGGNADVAHAGSDNTCLGYYAGRTLQDVGGNAPSGNTLIGHAAADVLTSGDDNIAIGRDVAMSSATVGSEIVIGVGATGQGTNTATIGNADMTDLYMAEDAATGTGAKVHAYQYHAHALAGQQSELVLTTYSDTTTTFPAIRIRKSNQDTVGNTVVDDNHYLGGIFFQGNNGSGFSNGASIESQVDEGAASISGTNIPADITFHTNNGSGDATRMTINAAGELDCIGVYNQSGGDSANVVVDGSGNIYRSTSALKYKTDIRDLPDIDISDFRPVVYKSKNDKVGDPTKDHFGFIADEIHDLGITELVTYGKDGEVEGFAYDKLTAVLVQKVQELSAKVEDLKKKVGE